MGTLISRKRHPSDQSATLKRHLFPPFVSHQNESLPVGLRSKQHMVKASQIKKQEY